MKNTVIHLADHITEDKPYNKCIVCPNLGVRCDGPNFLAMSGERWVEWCKLRKDYLGWSNQNLSDISGISKPTIDRILSGHGGDIRNSTMELITKALVNGTWGQFPCADPDAVHSGRMAEKIEAQETEITRLREEVMIAHKERRSASEKVNEDQQKKVEYLKRIVDDLQNSIKWYKKALGWHKKVIVAMGLVCAAALVALIIDLAVGDIGWIRY